MDSRLFNPLPPPQQPPSAYLLEYPIHHQPPPPLPPQPQQYQQQQPQQQQQHFQHLHGGLVAANVPGMGVAVAAPTPSSATAHPYSVGSLSPVTSLSSGQGFYTLESLEAGTSMHSAVSDPVRHGYEMVSTGHSYLTQKPPGALVFLPSQETTQVAISPGLTDAYLSQARLPGFHSGQESASAVVHPGHVYGWTGQSEQQVDRAWVQPWSHERTLAEGAEPRRRNQWPRFRKHQKKSKAVGLNTASATMAEPGIPSTGKTKGHEKGSGWCSVCQIDCTSAVILNQHVTGKKHKRRLEREGSEPAGKQQPKPKIQTQKVVADVLISGDKQDIQESTDRKNGADMNSVVAAVMSLAEHSQKRRREKDRDPALKKRRQSTVPPNGPNGEKAEKKSVSFEKCEICNITCTSKAILETHFIGKKHAARIRKLNKEVPVSKGDEKREEKAPTPACVGTDGNGQAGRGDKTAMYEDNTVVFPQSSRMEVAGQSAVTTADTAGQTVLTAEQVNGIIG